MNAGFGFQVVASDRETHARVGRLTTTRAVVETPVFMPVGTQATVKSQSPVELEAMGARLILANTYHLMLRPGSSLIQSIGGLQRFMAWPHAILTDSGGYQVFSLSKLRTIDDDGVVFRSHLDGTKYHLTPERAMEVQAELGSDIAMVLDECPPGQADVAELERALRRTTAWAKRCLVAPRAPGQARFGIVQGGTSATLRRAHLEDIAALPFEGIALGGFSVGEPIPRMYELLSELAPRLPAERPHYLMGVGTPYDLLHGIASGIDMFDCVLPTRNARNGQALTFGGRVNIKQQRHRASEEPLDARCGCDVCSRYSRAYLHHLYRAGEMLSARLLTQHNLSFYAALMRQARDAIAEQRFGRFKLETEARMRELDEVGRGEATSG